MATATHIIQDSCGSRIGFIVDGTFYTEHSVRQNISLIDNLSLDGGSRVSTGTALPALNYKEAVIRHKYDTLIRENPFERDIQKELLTWKKERSGRILQLEGARQTGKTTELEKFAYGNYEYVIEVNLASDTGDFVSVIKSGSTPLALERYCLTAGLPRFVNSAETILILDEIQQSTLVYNALRTLASNIKCDIVVTGSYLGRFFANLKTETGEPDAFFSAGTVQPLVMRPLSFSEFCRIFHAENLLYSIDLYGSSDSGAYAELLDLYHIYRQIGGYPEVVREYIRSRDISACRRVIERLLSLFDEESRHYFKNAVEVEIFDNVYQYALKEMCTEKQGYEKGIFQKITEIAEPHVKNFVTGRELRNALMWLKYAGILDTCGLAANGRIEDIAPGRRIYFGDCGIAAYLAKNSALAESSLTGLLTETFVYTELRRLYDQPEGIRKIKLPPAFSTCGAYELDFMLLGTDNTIYGIEVKTKGGDPKSLKFFIDKRLITKGIVARPSPGGHGDRFDTIPIYAVGCRFPYLS